MEKEDKKKSSQFSHQLTLGQKSSDLLTKAVGSWHYIISLLAILIIWIAVNAFFLIEYELGMPWDPYPFILLNLVLNSLGVLEASIILMSQNRQAEKDRQRAEYDYAVNRKAEREIEIIKKQLDNIERKLQR